MRIIDAVQGSDEWKAIRAGIPTASGFDRIITSSGKPSTSATKYMGLLLAEWFLGHPIDTGKSGFMERGTDMEAEAVGWYGFSTNTDPKTVGFCLRDDGRSGCSPDRLVGDDGLAEIKCPALETHMAYVLSDFELVRDYRIQVQGQLWVTGRKWVDIVSYNPELPKVIVRVERDDDFIAQLAEAVSAFADKMDLARERFAELREARISAFAAQADDHAF